MRVGWASAWLVLAGCGRIGFGHLAGDDVAGGDDAGTVLDGRPCQGTAHLVTDDFADGAISAVWQTFADPGTSVVELGGVLELHPATNQNERWAGYESTVRHDLRDDRIFVEVVQVPGVGAQILLAARDRDDRYVSIEYDRSDVVAALSEGSWSELARVGFDPVAHRFWQLRVRDGRMAWETSPDGITWRLLHEAVVPVDLTSIQILLSAGTPDPTSQPGTGHLDNFKRRRRAALMLTAPRSRPLRAIRTSDPTPSLRKV